MAWGQARLIITPCGHILFSFAYTLCMSRYTKANHRIFMQFVRRDVWHVSFLEPGLQTPLPKTLTFTDEGKIRELARRGEATGGESGIRKWRFGQPQSIHAHNQLNSS
jgi:hypothetical protein